MAGDLNNAIAAWCGASEARRARAAKAVGLERLYSAAEVGEEAAACFWYGVGSMGDQLGMDKIAGALMPTPTDVIEEALTGLAFAERDAFAVGLMAETGGSVKVLAQTWLTARSENKRAVAEAMGIYVGESDPGERVTAHVFHTLGEKAMEDRDLRKVFLEALIGEAKAGKTMMAAESNVALNAYVTSLNLRGEALTAEVIPPTRGGYLIGRDGRRWRAESMTALAAAINAQSVRPRIDFDHRTERSSPTFAGSTRAEGWLSNFRVNTNGGLDADMELHDMAATEIVRGAYRYLSPALIFDKGGNVIGLSSVALVNDPNFDLRVRAA